MRYLTHTLCVTYIIALRKLWSIIILQKTISHAIINGTNEKIHSCNNNNKIRACAKLTTTKKQRQKKRKSSITINRTVNQTNWIAIKNESWDSHAEFLFNNNFCVVQFECGVAVCEIKGIHGITLNASHRCNWNYPVEYRHRLFISIKRFIGWHVRLLLIMIIVILFVPIGTDDEER